MLNYNREVFQHCEEIEKCNQRGGRMLSVTDLIDAGTISVLQASFFMHAISKGASFIVGAKPGGAGKTTVMCALLNFLPLNTDIVHTENREFIRNAKGKKTFCFLCHEIGAGPYCCYLWGEQLTDLFMMKERGHIIVSNLHADTYDAAKRQICEENPVPEQMFNNIDLFVFINVAGIRRNISAVHIKTGTKHTLFNEKEIRPTELQPYIRLIENAVNKRIRLIRDFRKEVVDFLSKVPDIN
jgi:hypothetical protein